jgi:hypothetical protein
MKWKIWQVETLFALVISQSLRLPLSFRPPARPPFRPLGPLFLSQVLGSHTSSYMVYLPVLLPLSQALPCSCRGHVLSVTTHYCARPPPRPPRPTGSRRSYYRLRPITALLRGPPPSRHAPFTYPAAHARHSYHPYAFSSPAALLTEMRHTTLLPDHPLAVPHTPSSFRSFSSCTYLPYQ